MCKPREFKHTESYDDLCETCFLIQSLKAEKGQ